jgi:hypothetical protein
LKLNIKKVIFSITLVLLVIAFSELTLNLFAFVSPRVDRLLASPWISRDYSPTVPDERLIFRPNPAIPGHDSKGFRNPEVPPKAQIVALGDSQTYGTGIDAMDTWPGDWNQCLEDGVCGLWQYGPAHSLILGQAVAL